MEQEQNLDQNVIDLAPDIEEAMSDKTQQNDAQVEIKYDGDSVREALSDFQAELEFESEEYNNLSYLMNQFSEDKDYTPQEIDGAFSASGINPELLSKIEDQIIEYNRTNITRKEAFVSDTDNDIMDFENLCSSLDELSDKCSTIAGSDCCMSIKKLVKNLIQKLNQLKDSYNGDRAAWDNNEERLQQAWKKGVQILLLPEDQEEE